MKLKSHLSSGCAGLVLTLAPQFAAAQGPIETLYTMSNATTGNEVLVFKRNRRGNLRSAGAYATGGVGTGGSLGNQSGVVLDPSDRYLLVVNAGDGTISSLRVSETGLELVDTQPSGGFSPVSLTLFGNLVYVLNEGDPNDPGNNDNINGFRLNVDGSLELIEFSEEPLSEDATDPAQIGFNREGTVLLVTEKGTDRITTFAVNSDGTPSPPQWRSSAVPTPFGFQFGDRGIVYISEANQGGPGVVASYQVDPESAEVSSAIDILDTENATCWVVLSNDQTVGYATNTGSASISAFHIGFDGSMDHLFRRGDGDRPGEGPREGGPTEDGDNRQGRAVRTGEGPLDLVLTQDGDNLYTLDSTDNTITSFVVARNGALRSLNAVSVPDGSNGLAAR